MILSVFDICISYQVFVDKSRPTFEIQSNLEREDLATSEVFV